MKQLQYTGVLLTKQKIDDDGSATRLGIEAGVTKDGGVRKNEGSGFEEQNEFANKCETVSFSTHFANFTLLANHIESFILK